MFNGKRTLIKGEATIGEDNNYALYAELIAEEFAKRRGIPTAHYDLVKFLDENGQVIYGVLSESVLDPKKGEHLRSLRSFIGDEPDKEEEGLADVTNFDFTLDGLSDALYAEGYDEEQIGDVLTEYQKRLLLAIEMLNTDNHTENIAFIWWSEGDKKMIKLAPNFDAESTFLLDINLETIEKLINDYEGLRKSVDFADPRIGTFSAKEDGGHESLWKDTLVELCYDDTIADIFEEWQANPVDMDEVLEAVEGRIGVSLPENVKMMAKHTYDCRNKAMGRLMNPHKKAQTVSGWDSILSMLVNRASDVRTGEQDEVEGNLVKDIKDIGKIQETTVLKSMKIGFDEK